MKSSLVQECGWPSSVDCTVPSGQTRYVPSSLSGIVFTSAFLDFVGELRNQSFLQTDLLAGLRDTFMRLSAHSFVSRILCATSVLTMQVAVLPVLNCLLSIFECSYVNFQLINCVLQFLDLFL